tara:strand:+ start:3283 stop:3753 length:471 start_codon:yes stop_codon:yes gene_type:complete
MSQYHGIEESPLENLNDMAYVDRSLAVACTRGREAVVSRFRKLLNREGLSEQQWRVLRILYDHGSLTSVDIASLACIHKVSISRIIKSLENQGYTIRTTSGSDARARNIELTEYGRRWMKPLVGEALIIHRQIADDFGIEQYEQLLYLLKKLSNIN